MSWNILRAAQTPVAWSYVSPPPLHLMPGEKTGHYRAEARDTPRTDTRPRDSDRAGRGRRDTGYIAAFTGR